MSLPPTDPRLLALAQSFRTTLRHAVYLSRSMDGDGEITSMQMSTLSMAAEEPLRVSRVAANLGIRVPSATEQIIKLEQAGLVSRQPDPTDSRAVLVKLTDKGRAEWEDAGRRRNERVAALLAHLDDNDRALLAAALPVIGKLSRTA
ncbi:MAG: MarR family transcriptional regulator [Micrococcaceae bacterium]|jgi:DNA-binding MarR family transcriptional regulator|uniref:MarR family winged helix-turn-helix transcriptional regulator n=1 Tax=Arthrobacter sp. PL16 TaxID=3071720 RepID=UPI002DFB5542|nr:MarR family transcriptional regulator [Micrococcaceae bacterium]MEC5199031.1 DNA-binding MarR family transcriptional regulator [Arthrobacter sp. PL16]